MPPLPIRISFYLRLLLLMPPMLLKRFLGGFRSTRTVNLFLLDYLAFLIITLPIAPWLLESSLIFIELRKGTRIFCWYVGPGKLIARRTKLVDQLMDVLLSSLTKPRYGLCGQSATMIGKYFNQRTEKARFLAPLRASLSELARGRP